MQQHRRELGSPSAGQAEAARADSGRQVLFSVLNSSFGHSRA
jgi:hypothetical protein